MVAKKSEVERVPIKKSDDEFDVSSLVKSTAAELNKKFGSGTAMVMGDDEDDSDLLEIPFWIRTGIPALDYAVGGFKHPGFPGGRIVEIYGPESNGKSSLAAWILKCIVNDYEGAALYQDAECALSEERMEELDIDMSSVLYAQPETIDEVFDQQEAVVESWRKKKGFSNPIGIVWDSVAATTTRAELDGEYTDHSMGEHARLISKALRKFKSTISKQAILAVFINQTRDKIGISWGDKTTTFGGRALKFYSSVRIELRQIEKIKKKGDDKGIAGIRVVATVKKNKVAPPFKEAIFKILFDEGEGVIDQTGAMLEWLKDNDLIGGSAGRYEIEGKSYYLDGARDVLRDNDKLFQKYFDLCYTVEKPVKKGKASRSDDDDGDDD